MSTAQDLILQIESLVASLKAELNPPDANAGFISTAVDLTAALQRGGGYRLMPGTYAGNFKVTKPTVLSGDLTCILAPLDPLSPTLEVLSDAVSLQKFKVLNGAPDRDCVIVGAFGATQAAQQPSAVSLDALTIEAGAKGGHRGIALHGQNLAVRNCRVTGFWESGRDAQAVWIHNGPGPYTVENNYLEASGENILVGGESIRIPNCVPSDITIRGNTCFKPEAWRTNGATVKNSIELKIGRRVLIENNVIDGNWRGGQGGTPILLTVRNQNGDNPWAVIDDVTVRGNRTVRCKDGYAVSILGSDDIHPSEQTQKVLVEHNLFTDSPAGFLIGNGVAADLTITHNTLPAIAGTFLVFYDTRAVPVATPLTFTQNVLAQGEYGMNAGDYPYPFAPVVKFVNFTENVIEQHPARQIKIPAGNTWVPAGGLAALLDPKTFRLLAGLAGY